MSQSTPVPFFAAAPTEYSQDYTAQITRAFSLYTQQQQNPGPIKANSLNLTGLGVYANNNAAIAGGLKKTNQQKLQKILLFRFLCRL